MLAASARVRRLLIDAGAARRGEETDGVALASCEAELAAATALMPTSSALDHLSAALELSAFERDVLVLASMLETESDLPSLLAPLDGAGKLSFALALEILPRVHWSALVTDSPLRRLRLITLGAGEGTVHAPLRIDERVLHFLWGIPTLDATLAGLVRAIDEDLPLPQSSELLAEELARACTGERRSQVIALVGQSAATRLHVAAAAARRMGTRAYVLRPADLASSAGERDLLARLWERESLLERSLLVIDLDDGIDVRSTATWLARMRVPVVVTARLPTALLEPSLTLELSTTPRQEQEQLWRSVLGPRADALNGELRQVGAWFRIDAAAVSDVGRQLAARDPEQLGAALWDACRARARGRLDELAQRIEPGVSWNDIVLPDAELSLLRSIASHLRQLDRVFDEWGFAGKSRRGLGLSALFVGASGTGKTMAAEVLANELRLDLYRIDLSQVVNKYIGETEKNLRRVFDAADETGAILLFDEADALFGKRSEVRDSHDRYANVEVSYLLQRMEQYRGLAILTTNMKEALDTAFLRRLRFVVKFPFPDFVQRRRLWEVMFPAATPVDGIDVQKLARLNVAGGNIRNIALTAAFIAADADEPVRMRHLLQAARNEYQKLEKPLDDHEIQGWV
jgi:AAA+ superfamily predicted ATPase